MSRSSSPAPRTTLTVSLAGLSVLVLGGCGGGPGSSSPPSSTVAPVSAAQFCELGKDATTQVRNADRYKPDYLDRIKTAFKPLGERAPSEIADDMRAYLTYIKGATSVEQLDPARMSPDMKVTTDRIDTWWKQHCGSAFGS